MLERHGTVSALSRLSKGGIALLVALVAGGAFALDRVAQPSFEILPGSHVDDASMCEDPEQSGETTLDDPQRHSDIRRALRSLITEGSSPLAPASVADELEAPAAAMERLSPGPYTLILPNEVRGPEVEHIRFSFVKNDDETISMGSYSFCFAS